MPRWHTHRSDRNRYLLIAGIALLIVIVALTFILEAVLLWVRVSAILILAVLVPFAIVLSNRQA